MDCKAQEHLSFFRNMNNTKTVILYWVIEATGTAAAQKRDVRNWLSMLEVVESIYIPFHTCTALLKLSRHYKVELYVRAQISESVGQDIRRSLPSQLPSTTPMKCPFCENSKWISGHVDDVSMCVWLKTRRKRNIQKKLLIQRCQGKCVERWRDLGTSTREKTSKLSDKFQERQGKQNTGIPTADFLYDLGEVWCLGRAYRRQDMVEYFQ